MEAQKHASHQLASQLLHNKFILVLGDSIQRSVYKDLVLLLQKDRFISAKQLKTKGEMSFENDSLVEGGCQSQMHNGSNYREIRQFQSDHHLVRFYFVTRIYSDYMQSILEDFQRGMKPDVVIVNSCVWDISRYNSRWISDYKDNLEKFFGRLRDIMPEETLIIWNLAMPVGERIRGGFLVPEIEHKAAHLRFDVVEANFYSGTLADEYGLDVLDLHFQFRFSLQHRTNDGVHWNALAHRRITTLLLQHAAQAWGVIWPAPLTSVGDEVSSHTKKGQKHTEATDQQPVRDCGPELTGATNYYYPRPRSLYSDTERYKEFYSDSLPVCYMDFETSRRHFPQQPQVPALSYDMHDRDYRSFDYRYRQSQQAVMRSRNNRKHYAPYTNIKTSKYSHHHYY